MRDVRSAVEVRWVRRSSLRSTGRSAKEHIFWNVYLLVNL